MQETRKILSKELVVFEQLPLIPEDWDYDASVEKVRQLVYKWKNLTIELANELAIAKQVLCQWGGDRRSEQYQVNKSSLDKTWGQYCQEIGSSQQVINRWLARFFPRPQIQPPDLPKIQSQVLYADPPWQYMNTGFDQSAEKQYPTLSTKDLCKYKDGNGVTVNDLTEDRAVLFLWVTEPMVKDGLQVMESWGFLYKAQMVWIKDRSPGIGFWVKSKHELLFIGAKGTELHPKTLYDSVFNYPVTDHSRKPLEVYGMIEEMYTGPYVELFARNNRTGWESWGNEVPQK